MVDGPKNCRDCGVEYSPLTYFVGRKVKAHHFHPSGGSSGIFRIVSNVDPRDYERKLGLNFYGWVGMFGAKRSRWISAIEEVPSSKLIGVRAFCAFHGQREELTEGYVLERDDVLFPLCADLFQSGYANVAQTFRVEEGQVLFSQA